jgi:WD40 repeat protein
LCPTCRRNSCALQASATPAPAPPPAPSHDNASVTESNTNDDEEDDEEDEGPQPAPGPQEPEYNPEEEFDADELQGPTFPITHELSLKDHSKVISALALDPSGARVLSGSHDYDCKLWDFGGMDHRCKPFKTWEPAGTYYVRLLGYRFCVLLTCAQVNDLKYSNDGQRFLVMSGTIQPKIYDRDGEEGYVPGDLPTFQG